MAVLIDALNEILAESLIKDVKVHYFISGLIISGLRHRNKGITKDEIQMIIGTLKDYYSLLKDQFDYKIVHFIVNLRKLMFNLATLFNGESVEIFNDYCTFCQSRLNKVGKIFFCRQMCTFYDNVEIRKISEQFEGVERQKVYEELNDLDWSIKICSAAFEVVDIEEIEMCVRVFENESSFFEKNDRKENRLIVSKERREQIVDLVRKGFVEKMERPILADISSRIMKSAVKIFGQELIVDLFKSINQA